MTELWIGYLIVLLIMFIGVIGNFIPGVPGTSLLLVAGLGHQLYFGEHGGIDWFWIGALAVLTAAAFGLDYLATLIGAKKLGATWKGMLGALRGLFVGLFIPPQPIGLIIGPFIGAMGFEWAFGREAQDSAKAGAGAVIGMLLGAVGSMMCAVAMFGIFAFKAWPSSNALPPMPVVPIATEPASEPIMEPADPGGVKE